jgi:hypothetical protein
MRTRSRLPVVLATAGAFAFATLTSVPAAPIASGGAALKTAAPSDVVDVYYRRGWGYGGGAVVGGLALGLIGGAMIAAASRPYGYGYGYGYPAYGYGYGYPAYGYAPAYYGYAPAYYGYPGYYAPRRHYVRRHYVRRAYWGHRPYYGYGVRRAYWRRW